MSLHSYDFSSFYKRSKLGWKIFTSSLALNAGDSTTNSIVLSLFGENPCWRSRASGNHAEELCHRVSKEMGSEDIFGNMLPLLNLFWWLVTLVPAQLTFHPQRAIWRSIRWLRPVRRKHILSEIQTYWLFYLYQERSFSIWWWMTTLYSTSSAKWTGGDTGSFQVLWAEPLVVTVSSKPSVTLSWP